MSENENRSSKTEKQAEMLRHNLFLRKKQLEERERLKQRRGQSPENPETPSENAE